ncbi:hypothetical protein MP228_005243 [Amoeboaphelidium protococcarum]|nr:hypothetical protein MP228_005243 [Amoeboaphelidium protococcarum]
MQVFHFAGVSAGKKHTLAISFNDGAFTVHQLFVSFDECTLLRSLSDAFKQYQSSLNSNENLVAVGLDDGNITRLLEGMDGCEHRLDDICSQLWFELDLIPFVFDAHDYTDSKRDLIMEQAESMARKCSEAFGPLGMPKLRFNTLSQVLVDYDNHIRLCYLNDYENWLKNVVDEGSPPSVGGSDLESNGQLVWDTLLSLSQQFRDRKLKMSFFNATAQGGGVALMRHALIRLFRLLDIDIKWYVPKPDATVFRITKNNHNLLQGAYDDKKIVDGMQNSDGTQDLDGKCYEFGAKEQDIYEDWVAMNCNRFWLNVFKDSDIIVLDDPQTVGFVKHIKQVNTDAKIIYRSHIEIRTDLIDRSGSRQAALWDYMRQYIDQCDLFISHPVQSFVPRSLIGKLPVKYMPASTDPLDGLNKKLSLSQSRRYLEIFNHISINQCGNELEFLNNGRPYIIQIARFDPSKGIHDVIDSYCIFRERLSNYNPCIDLVKVPQLVITGHGSIDDPDAKIIFDQAVDHISNSQRNAKYQKDILLARIYPEDRILNALLTNNISDGGGCAVCLQLSHHEGFEVKVTEAMRHGVPVIIYGSGGLGLQLPADYPYIAKTGDIQQVADFMHQLVYTDCRQKVSEQCQQYSQRPEFWTPFQAVNWLWLALSVTGNISQSGKNIVNLFNGNDRSSRDSNKELNCEYQPFHYVKQEWIDHMKSIKR